MKLRKRLTMRSVTLAVDGSEHSMRASEMAGLLSRVLEIPVDIITVVPRSIAMGAAELPDAKLRENDLLTSTGNQVVEKASEIVSHAGGDVRTTEVLGGSPAREIVRRAEDSRADWIVMGRRGLGGVKGLIRGSVSNNVAHMTSATLVTTHSEEIGISRILLPVDGSDHAKKAADLSGVLSARFHATVDVLHVVPEHEYISPGLYRYIDDYVEIEQYYENRKAILKSQAGRLTIDAARQIESMGGSVGEEEVVVGEPAEEILEMARRVHADAIVMGRRGLGDLGGLMFGSVSHKVGQLTERTLITTE